MNVTHVVVNADDFGQSEGVNRGVITAVREGIVTSVSLMVRWPHAPAAVESISAHQHVSVGLHLDLGEWFYDRGWYPRYEVVKVDDATAEAEVGRQVDRFIDLVGRAPSHIDSHQHVHRHEPVRSQVLKAAKELDVPVREVADPAAYVGGFYGQNDKGESHPELISPAALISLIHGLGPGWYEIGCHPGDGSDRGTTYGKEREIETATLCDPRVAAAVADSNIHIISRTEVGSCSACASIAVTTP